MVVVIGDYYEESSFGDYYEEKSFKDRVKCDRLADLGKHFEAARKEGGGALADQLEDLAYHFKWNVNLCIIYYTLMFKFGFDNKWANKANEMLLQTTKDAPEENLNDIEKAHKTIELIEEINSLKLYDSDYDAAYMIEKIKEEFHIT